MAIENEKSLVKFGYGFDSSTSKETGMISFDPSSQAIYVGNEGEAVLVTSSVKDANFKNSVLTITKVGGEIVTLDFSDVASADQTTKILGKLRTDVSANATAIANLSTTVTNLDTSYKAADALLSERLDTLEGLVGDGDVDERIAAAVEAEAELRTLADSSIRTDFAAEDALIRAEFALADSSIRKDVSAYQTTNDAAVQANATAIGEVSTNLNTHATNGDIHITAQERTDWNAAKTAIDAFLDDEAISDNVVNTLKEIQEYINGEGEAAEQLLKKISDAQDTADQAVLDASAAQSTADAALALGQAAATQSEFNSYKTTNDAALAEVKATADAAAVKTEVESALALKADASTVYTKSETYTKTEVDGLVAGANVNASTAESNAKTYADAIKVNGQSQTNQEITVSGLNILVGGTGTNKDASLSYAVEDLYSKVDVASKAGVQSLAVNADSSNYADVNASTGAVTLTIKKVALADATESNTGVADAWDVKESIRVAKEGAISTVQGAEGDASTAATVAGAKKYAKEYADAQIEAAALRWTVL